MSDWQVVITSEAEADLRGLDAPVRKRITEKLRWFEQNFAHITPFPLGEPWKGFFKWRVGDWRVIYGTDDAKRLVIIHRIGRRDGVYKLKK